MRSSSSVSSWREEDSAAVRAVDSDVAEGTGLVFLRLVVEARGSRRTGRGGLGVAAYAEQIDLILHEHALIG